MKATVTLITLIIIFAIVVVIGLMMWLYLSGLFKEVRQSGETGIKRSQEVLSSCIKIEEAYKNSFFIRNCGDGIINEDSLNVYVDGELFDFDLEPSSIKRGKTGAIILHKAWGMSIGRHSLRITNPNTEALTYFEAELPDSCVLALDFDEGSGDKVYDKSSYGNHGILHESPEWVKGKFGKALYFNHIGYVDIPNSPSLNITGNEITLQLWFKLHEESADYFLCKDYSYRIENGGGPDVWISVFNTSDNKGTAYTGTHLLETWYNVVGMVNTTHIKIYLDGIEKDTDIWVGNIKPDNENLRINACVGSIDRANVTIDSVRIYNKALTPDETIIFRII